MLSRTRVASYSANIASSCSRRPAFVRPALRYCSETFASTPPASRASKRWRARSTTGRSSATSWGDASVTVFGWGAGAAGDGAAGDDVAGAGLAGAGPAEAGAAPSASITNAMVRMHAGMPQRYRGPRVRRGIMRPEEAAMANDRGLLPKARRDELSEPLQKMLDRWYRNAYEDD